LQAAGITTPDISILSDDFRYNARVALGVDDDQRAVKALLGVKGKRLTYRTTDRA
jgi:hypothetical protein